MSQPSASLASRAIGSMFFSVFGGAWLVAWSVQAFGVRPLLVGALIATALLLLLAAIRQFQANRSAHVAEAETPEAKRASRIFNYVNAGQWIAVFLAGNILNNLGHKEWFIPAFIFIVGVHFLPLASVFKARRHLVTGSALILLALIYPFVAKLGPSSPVGCLGAGLILWASALAGLWTKPLERVSAAS